MAAKTPKRSRRIRAGAKVKRTIMLTPRASQLLDVHASMEGADACTIAEKAIIAYCRRWVVHDLGERRAEQLPPAGEGIPDAA